MDTNSTPLSICLIDDDVIYQFTTKRIIQLANPLQKVLVFSDGKEALDFFLQEQNNIDALPDVIFLDINMPVMNGWEFLESYELIRENIQKPIAIYMVSSSVDSKDKIRSERFTSVKDFIVKPLDRKTFTDILRTPKTIIQ